MTTRFSYLAMALSAAISIGAAAAPPAGDAAAEAAQVRQMIDALRPAPTRNLVVRPVEAPASVPAPAVPVAPVAPPPVAPPPAPPPPAAEPPTGLSLALPFQPGRAQLTPDAGALLGSLLAALLSPELRDTSFIIEGHTDASGSPAQNLRLSQQRADEVRQYLTAFGIAPARLRAVGKGATEPLNPSNPRAAENRRVRIVAAP